MRVLLVEDDASLAVLFRMFLGRMGKGALEITHAFTGEEALQRVSEIRPDVVLLDIMLPGMDGIEVCRRLCAQSDLAGIKVAMVTALDDEGKRRAAREAGAMGYWVKPISPKELVDWIVALRAAGEGADTISYANRPAHF
jgi:DNA-binding response OmpR family regulator